MTLLALLLAFGASQQTAPVLAEAIAAQHMTREQIAFELAWVRHESHFADRIIVGDCKRWECDRGRARGMCQAHRGAAGPDWDRLTGNVVLQVHVCSRLSRWALREAHGDPRLAFRILGASRGPMRGEGERVRSYQEALGKL